MIAKFFKALWEWLFIPHGYLSFKQYTGSDKQLNEIAAMQRIIKGKAKSYKCLACGNTFWAMKPNTTCRDIVCFFSYRLKGGS